MKTIKRIITFILTVVLIFTFTACGSNENKEAIDTATDNKVLSNEVSKEDTVNDNRAEEEPTEKKTFFNRKSKEEKEAEKSSSKENKDTENTQAEESKETVVENKKESKNSQNTVENVVQESKKEETAKTQDSQKKDSSTTTTTKKTSSSTTTTTKKASSTTTTTKKTNTTTKKETTTAKPVTTTQKVKPLESVYVKQTFTDMNYTPSNKKDGSISLGVLSYINLNDSSSTERYIYYAFQNPSVLYYGMVIPLYCKPENTSNLTFVIKQNNEEVYRATVAPGTRKDYNPLKEYEKGNVSGTEVDLYANNPNAQYRAPAILINGLSIEVYIGDSTSSTIKYSNLGFHCRLS